MFRFKLAQILCSFFPLLISQNLRNLIFPRKLAIQMAIDFSKKSITGSIFKGNTLDFHGYPFSIHGFFDWRNVILAHTLFQDTLGDIVEIGANIGTETIGFSDVLINKGHVHAFEPLPTNIEALKRLENKNIIVHSCALSRENGFANFKVPPKTSSGEGKIISDHSVTSGNEFIKVQIRVLDDHMLTFKNVKLIAIDTEGHEPLVLEGSINTIKTFRPAVIIEVSPKLLKKTGDRKIEDLYAFFNQNQYVCYKIGRFTISNVKAADLKSKTASNWFCLPKGSPIKIEKLNKILLMRILFPWFLLPSLVKQQNK